MHLYQYGPFRRVFLDTTRQSWFMHDKHHSDISLVRSLHGQLKSSHSMCYPSIGIILKSRLLTLFYSRIFLNAHKTMALGLGCQICISVLLSFIPIFNYKPLYVLIQTNPESVYCMMNVFRVVFSHILSIFFFYI